MATDAQTRAEVIARFPNELVLPDASPELVASASDAVRQEYRASVRWKRLRCRDVAPVLQRQDEAIYVLEVGQAIEFDWTWEGAVAFRPLDIDEFDGDADTTADFAPSANGSGAVWSGEVVEVDEAKGKIYVWVSDPSRPPSTGSFYVRPFEFLAFLHSIYCDESFSGWRKRLSARLNACRGEVHPIVQTTGRGGLPELAKLWSHSWCVLWGPPGTGKTHTLGRQVASLLGDPTERILVVSTTNRATDEAAFAIGRAIQAVSPAAVQDGRVLRIGKSAHYESFEERGLTAFLKGTETDLLRQVGLLTKCLNKAQGSDERAVLRQQIQSIRRQMKDASFNVFVSEDVRTVVSTSFKAITLLNDPDVRAVLSGDEAPFTTVVIDEAGLISRSAAAALSMLASRRIVLVGDSKQLAPISKISRILPTTQATWLASSGLSHLRSVEQSGDAVHLIREQHRMHPHVCSVVSAYQYENKLTTAPAVLKRSFSMPALLADQPRSVWYVLDEDGDDLPSIRAERGPGNRSWVRPKTKDVLRKVFSDPDVRKARGLFISPFVAQARDIRSFLASESLESWSAATVHSQQGTEADFVIFDTVNAGSCGWPYDEWRRLVNVGLSRAREFILVLASRAEMREPYLKSLTFDLAPRILKWSGRAHKWIQVPPEAEYEVPEEIAANPHLIGSQLKKRKELRPVLSFEQQRLCGLKLDGKPRLVRGVAGSGKTVVLAYWLLQTIQRLKAQAEFKVLAVFANRTLQKLIADTIEDAWKTEGDGSPFPWQHVELRHIKDLLELLLPQVGLRPAAFEFEYDKAAAAFLERRPADEVSPFCAAMFIDEGQDMGPNTLKLLSALVAHSDREDANSRSVNIFYDNAQNIYGRSTPRWSELGLDMRGRSTVMKESFRSTKPITEFALNVLYRLQPPETDADHRELVERGLIEKTKRNGQDWWCVRFNQVDGPNPMFRKFARVEDEFDAIGAQVANWIKLEGVKPSDICILYNNWRVANRIEQHVAPKVNAAGARLCVLTGKAFDDDPAAVRATTPHSFKGYDSEIVVIAGADEFIAKEILANNLYVAMTRARSMLAVYGLKTASSDKSRIITALEECLGLLVDRPEVEKDISGIDEFEEVLGRIGQEHRSWLEAVWKKRWIEHEPILEPDGAILAEPLFWFKEDDRICACFGNKQPGKHIEFKLQDAGVMLLKPGSPLPQMDRS
jgi:superfamily I DNA/RNA helicase